MSNFTKIGDWNRVRKLTDNLEKEAKAAQVKSLKRFGLKVEGLAKEHISKQDLGWTRLRPQTISRKIRKGYSDNILVETSTYFQSITSWVENDTAYAGVRRQKKYADGAVVSDIARLHEFGSASGGIPARPLWRPSFAEAIEWHRKNNTPEQYFVEALSKY